jgi:hypothetical protein
LAPGVNNQKLLVKDEFGGSNTGGQNITIYATLGELIDGSSSYTIATNYGFVLLFYHGGWHIIGEKA